ncbi:NAD(P)/FAD-dependent oxidoreductase, partial [Pseudomonas laurentiana]|nr:NAD(P)/FAD-dependent oxidoreductase [Pseudomonas laurentiana]
NRSYPPREVLWDYIKGRVEKAGVRDYIRFNTVVRQVTFDEHTQRFSVLAHDYKNDTETLEEFDYVINACGHFSTPIVPYFPGFEHFAGRILHAHDFREALEFKDKNLLIVGSSYSAEDIGSQCYKYGARSITSCYRTAPMGYKWPANWEEKPLLQRLENDRAYFIDGTSKPIDAVILCTGYKHHFPFLPESLCLKTDNRLWPRNLYKGIFWEPNPKLIYLGMQDQWYSFNMFDAQAWYARDVILGRIALPDAATRNADCLQWQAREAELQTNQQMFEYQGAYIQQLVDATDYPSFNIPAVNETFLHWKHDKATNIMGYRDKSYRSLMTGTQSPPHHTPWLEALDDSMEAYLNAPHVSVKSAS